LLGRYRRRQRRPGLQCSSGDRPWLDLQRAVTGPKRPLKISVDVEYADGDSELLDVPVDGDGVQMRLVVCLGIS
jgi:hypothetical protein